MMQIVFKSCFILLLLVAIVVVYGRGGRGGGSRGRSSFRISRFRGGSSWSPNKRPTAYGLAIASGYVIDGMSDYRTRYYGTPFYNSSPAVCYSEYRNIIMSSVEGDCNRTETDTNGIWTDTNYNGTDCNSTVHQQQDRVENRRRYFVCPSAADSSDETQCCGSDNNQHCCSQTDKSLEELLQTTTQPLPTTTQESSVCQLPIVGGSCRNFTPSYGFDIYSLTCQRFVYSGCDGNANRFETLEGCRASCEGKVDICRLPITAGPCSSFVYRWAFDPLIDGCREFRYSGCLGNFNRFYSLEECEASCT